MRSKLIIAAPLFAVIMAAMPAIDAMEVPDVGGSRPASHPPEVTILEQDRRRIRAVVVSEWTRPLEESFMSAPGLTASEVISRATAGLHLASNTFELPRLATPPVLVLGSTFEEIGLGYLPRETLEQLAAALSANPVSIVGVGISQHEPVATLDAQMLTFDPGSATLRRYDRVEVDVRLDAMVDIQPDAVAGIESQGQIAPAISTSAEAASVGAVTESVLADGTWFKFPVGEEGIYRIDINYLTALGVSPQAVDPARVRIFGNGGMPLPALNSAPRPVDLVEQPIFVSHDGDTIFEEGEFVLFFGRGVQNWYYDTTTQDWAHVTNPFSTSNYYFIQTDGPPGSRIETAPWPGFINPQTASEFEARMLVDNDEIHLEQDGSGSGLEWFGAFVDSEVSERTILNVSPPGMTAGTVRYLSRVVVRSNPAATIQFRRGGQVLASVTPGIVNLGDQLGAMARDAVLAFTESTPSEGRLQLDLRLVGGQNDPGGWLDWLRIFYPRQFAAENGMLRFSSTPGVSGQVQVRLSGFPAEPQVWDVTTIGAYRRLSVERSGSDWLLQFAAEADAPREFVAFVQNASAILSPEPGEPVPNQNLHGLSGYPEFAIVTPEAFLPVAENLAARRRQEGLTVTVTSVSQIYNEFSGGVPDMRAVRDYFRFLYDRGAEGERSFRYALLLGDGHFDFRGLTDDPDSPLNPNWIFPYQTDNTLIKGSSYTSDDYFGLLDSNEGVWRWRGDSGTTFERVDIGIGRWPVETLEEAQLMLSKLDLYESQASQGPWRTRYLFVADDGPAGSRNDGDLHTQNADVVAEAVVDLYPEINTEKIYAISYPTVTTSNGRRVPEANRDIVSSLEDGVLVWNYSGHGGIEGLADERIFTKEDIAELNTGDRLALFITATCTFGRFDTDREKSGAEELLLKEVGGSVALFTTVRIVVTWSNPNTFNLGLNLELNNHLLKRETDGKGLRLGDVMRITKNSSVGLQGNNRKFNLLGDPTMRLALPRRLVTVDAVSGTPVDTTGIKLRALERVRLDGSVVYQDEALDQAFNGVVEVTVFDAARAVEIDQDLVRHIPSGTYTIQSDLIYRGKVQATNGRFSSEFVVPRDIAFSDLPGRIAMYASSEQMDGFGAREDVSIGGTADNPVSDTQGPEIELFLNDTTFVSGGLTTPEPLLMVSLSDESGINTVGTGVGHEMLLVIDGDEQNAIEIGDRFEGTLGSFQNGTVRFRLPPQETGDHVLSVRAWDVVNNSSEQTLEYVVIPSEEIALNNVFNYPNPMVGQTRFVFEHNQPPGTPAAIEIRLYTISGRLIQILDGPETLPSGMLSGGLVQIPWDGRDQDLDPVSPGIYLYRIRVSVDLPSGEQDSAEHLGRLAVVG